MWISPLSPMISFGLRASAPLTTAEVAVPTMPRTTAGWAPTLALLLAGGLSPGLSGCSATPLVRSQVAVPLSPARQEARRATEALREWETRSVPSQQGFEATVELNRRVSDWLRAMAFLVPTERSEVAASLRHIRELNRIEPSFAAPTLRFIHSSARLMGTIDDIRRGHDLGSEAFIDAFITLHPNLETHAHHPILRLAEYLDTQGDVFHERGLDRMHRLSVELLRLLDGILVCSPSENGASIIDPMASESCYEEDYRLQLARTQVFFGPSQDRVDRIMDRINGLDRLLVRFIKNWRQNFATQGILTAPLSLALIADRTSVNNNQIRITRADGSVLNGLVNHGLNIPRTEQESIERALLATLPRNHAEFRMRLGQRMQERAGYRVVTDLSNTPLRDHMTDRGCFEAALCPLSERHRFHFEGRASDIWSVTQELNTNYRPVRIGEEPVRNGDILIYTDVIPQEDSEQLPPLGPEDFLTSVSLPAPWPGLRLLAYPLHASTVIATDAQGLPTRAIGKMGVDGAVAEHDPYRVFNIYGPVFFVYRRRQ